MKPDSRPPHERARQSQSGQMRQQLQDREAQLRDLRSRYARFGESVLQVVMDSFSRDAGLRRLVHRITGRIVPKRDRQHQVLVEFLSRHGEEVFLRQARGDAGSTATDIEPSTATPQPDEKPSSAAPAVGARRKVRLPDGRIIADRRESEERRSGNDRRDTVDIIYSNKRFGGDRRKKRDRRQTPPDFVD